MCIIAVKFKGSDFCPAETIARCMETNPHGFSMAWNQDGHVLVYRTMSAGSLLEKYKELVATLDPRQTGLVFHARIATHGSHRVENCHGFTHGNMAFFHNGVLRGVESRDDKTDSEVFFRDFFAPIHDAMGMKEALRLSAFYIGQTNNKFAVITGDGEINLVSGSVKFSKNQFKDCRGKIYFSNDSWKPAESLEDTHSLFGGYGKSGSFKHPDTPRASTSLPRVGPRERTSGAGASFLQKALTPRPGTDGTVDLESLFQDLYTHR